MALLLGRTLHRSAALSSAPRSCGCWNRLPTRQHHTKSSASSSSDSTGSAAGMQGGVSHAQLVEVLQRIVPELSRECL
jgi:hypothetical protein